MPILTLSSYNNHCAAQEGPQKLNDILTALEALRTSADVRLPVVHCFGFGHDHDRELLEGISDARDGECFS